jgi:hypothetical protein
MGKIYEQLSIEERTMIQTQLELGIKPAAIATGMNRSASTLSCELRRNGWTRPKIPRGPGRTPVAGGYHAAAAHKRARACAITPRVERRLRPGTALWGHVLCYLKAGYSPEQIAGTEPPRYSRSSLTINSPCTGTWKDTIALEMVRAQGLVISGQQLKLDQAAGFLILLQSPQGLFKFPIKLFQVFLVFPVFVDKSGMIEYMVNCAFKHLHIVDRFGDVVPGASFHGLYGIGDQAHAGNNDDWCIR